MKRRTPLRSDPEILRAWQRRSRGTLKRSAMPQAPRRRDPAKEGPQWDLCHRLTCAACWGADRLDRGLPLDWALLPGAFGGPRCDGHHEASEYGNTRRDHDCLPLCRPCHRERTGGTCSSFWGYHRVAPMQWERVVGVGLDIDPGPILVEMRRRSQHG